ncbi:hypothetical protein ASG57_34360 [Bradyrhizobium sp. Leaf396]|nr:hypothetical protein ASG57_34360 [Bradyrhizobium sp. Leaf396]
MRHYRRAARQYSRLLYTKIADDVDWQRMETEAVLRGTSELHRCWEVSTLVNFVLEMKVELAIPRSKRDLWLSAVEA